MIHQPGSAKTDRSAVLHPAFAAEMQHKLCQVAWGQSEQQHPDTSSGLREQTVLFWNHFCVDLASCFVFVVLLSSPEIGSGSRSASYLHSAALIFVFPISLSELRGLHPHSVMLPLPVFMVCFLRCSAWHSPCTASQTCFFYPLNTDWPYWSASPHFKLFNNLVSTCTFATSVIFLKWNWSHTLTWVKFQTFLNMYKKVFFFSVNVLNTSHKEFEDVIQALYGANNWMWVLIHLCCCLCCFLCCSSIYNLLFYKCLQ